MSNHHVVKLRDCFADDVLSGAKSFEVRENDRGYQTGDTIQFQVIDHLNLPVHHPLENVVYTITYVLSGWGIKENWCVFSIKNKANPTDMYESLFRNENFSPDKTAQPEVHIDPNTQCVDCRWGVPVSSPDKMATSIECDIFHVMRSVQDTCIAGRVDLTTMTAGGQEGGDI